MTECKILDFVFILVSWNVIFLRFGYDNFLNNKFETVEYKIRIKLKQQHQGFH